jgi:uncharacterized circularly permuted ATP-grasp superfamily protein
MAQKKSRQTFEKIKREQAVKERRALKQERKKAARMAKAAGISPDELGHEEDAGADGTIPLDPPSTAEPRTDP